MFPVGTVVYHTTSKRSGTVLECDGDTVYVVQHNGVELEFAARELSVTPPGTRKPDVYAAPSRTLTMSDIAPEHQEVLSIIPAMTLQAVAALFERRPGAGKFSALNVAQKLNFIAETTAVPYRTMRAFRDRPGTLKLMMGKGLADSQRKSGR